MSTYSFVVINEVILGHPDINLHNPTGNTFPDSGEECCSYGGTLPAASYIMGVHEGSIMTALCTVSST